MRCATRPTFADRYIDNDEKEKREKAVESTQKVVRGACSEKKGRRSPPNRATP